MALSIGQCFFFFFCRLSSHHLSSQQSDGLLYPLSALIWHINANAIAYIWPVTCLSFSFICQGSWRLWRLSCSFQRVTGSPQQRVIAPQMHFFFFCFSRVGLPRCNSCSCYPLQSVSHHWWRWGFSAFGRDNANGISLHQITSCWGRYSDADRRTHQQDLGKIQRVCLFFCTCTLFRPFSSCLVCMRLKNLLPTAFQGIALIFTVREFQL